MRYENYSRLLLRITLYTYRGRLREFTYQNIIARILESKNMNPFAEECSNNTDKLTLLLLRPKKFN